MAKIDPADSLRKREHLKKLLADKNMDATGLSAAIGRGKDYVRDFLAGRKSDMAASDWQKINDLLNPDGRALIAPEMPRPEPKFFSEDRNMPVYSAAEGGNGHIIVSKDALEYVRRPYVLDAVTDAYAILVVGESMVPAFEPGDKAWVNPRLPPMRNKDCVFYEVDEYNDSKATIKRLISWTDTYWTVEQYNPPKTFKLPRPRWGLCHRVVGKFNA